MYEREESLMEILKADNIKKYYQTGETTVKALDGISLGIQSGEFVAIVGSSGSGKSTLLHMLGGLDTPTDGTIRIEDKDISKMSSDELTIFRRRKIGFVFQNYNLLPFMSVYKNIVLPIQLDGGLIILSHSTHIKRILLHGESFFIYT